MHEKVMYAPIYELGALHGVVARVAEPAIGLIVNMAAAAPYEELRLKGK